MNSAIESGLLRHPVQETGMLTVLGLETTGTQVREC